MLAYHIRLVFKAFMVIREKGVRSVNQFSFALKGCDFGALTMTMIIVRRQQFLNAVCDNLLCIFFLTANNGHLRVWLNGMNSPSSPAMANFQPI